MRTILALGKKNLNEARACIRVCDEAKAEI